MRPQTQINELVTGSQEGTTCRKYAENLNPWGELELHLDEGCESEAGATSAGEVISVGQNMGL